MGLAAAAHLAARGIEPLVLEAGDAVGRERSRVGPRARVLAVGVQPRPGRRGCWPSRAGTAPDPRRTRPGAEIVERYLEPLAALPAIAPRAHLGARVVAVTRHGIDKLKDEAARRRRSSWSSTRRGEERRYLASAVIDASGTWTRPNPLGAGGAARAAASAPRAGRISYGIPDVLGARPGALRRPARAGRRQRPLRLQRDPRPRDAARLRAGDRDRVGDPRRRPGPQVRRRRRRPAAGARRARRGGARAGRRRLGRARRRLPDPPACRSSDGRWSWPTATRSIAADEVIAATGFRPDLSLLGELRLDLDDRVEAARALAPLIDPERALVRLGAAARRRRAQPPGRRACSWSA